jgi:hypothetical protein
MYWWDMYIYIYKQQWGCLGSQMFSNWGTGPQFMKKMMNWLNHGILWFPIVAQHHLLFPIGSMYGIYANIWGILMVNVTIYSIHGSYGFLFNTFGSCGLALDHWNYWPTYRTSRGGHVNKMHMWKDVKEQRNPCHQVYLFDTLKNL